MGGVLASPLSRPSTQVDNVHATMRIFHGYPATCIPFVWRCIISRLTPPQQPKCGCLNCGGPSPFKKHVRAVVKRYACVNPVPVGVGRSQVPVGHSHRCMTAPRLSRDIQQTCIPLVCQTKLSYTNIHIRKPHTTLPLKQGTQATPATTRPTVNKSRITNTNTSHARAPPFARRSALWPRLRLVSFSRCVPAARCASPHASRRCSVLVALLLGVLRVRARHVLQVAPHGVG
jgi:hypothetical protein